MESVLLAVQNRIPQNRAAPQNMNIVLLQIFIYFFQFGVILGFANSEIFETEANDMRRKNYWSNM